MKKQSKLLRSLAAWRAWQSWCRKRDHDPYELDSSVTFVNGWNYGYAAAVRDAKPKARKR